MASSLFCFSNSLFRRLRNSGENTKKISALRNGQESESALIGEISLFLPCLTGNSGETGSRRTACTTNPLPQLRRPPPFTGRRARFPGVPAAHLCKSSGANGRERPDSPESLCWPVPASRTWRQELRRGASEVRSLAQQPGPPPRPPRYLQAKPLRRPGRLASAGGLDVSDRHSSQTGSGLSDSIPSPLVIKTACSTRGLQR